MKYSLLNTGDKWYIIQEVNPHDEVPYWLVIAETTNRASAIMLLRGIQ